jgi:phosphomannomutase
MFKRNKSQRIKKFFEEYGTYYKVYKKGNKFIAIKPDDLGYTFIIFGKENKGQVENEKAIELELGINTVKTTLEEIFKHLGINLEEIEKEEN